jgi:hypothetical protein
MKKGIKYRDYSFMKGTSWQNRRGEWVPAIPEPYLLWFPIGYKCDCGDHFWTREGYEGHYALKHILAL